MLFYGNDDSFLFAGPTAISALIVDAAVVVYGFGCIGYWTAFGIGKAVLGVLPALH